MADESGEQYTGKRKRTASAKLLEAKEDATFDAQTGPSAKARRQSKIDTASASAAEDAPKADSASKSTSKSSSVAEGAVSAQKLRLKPGAAAAPSSSSAPAAAEPQATTSASALPATAASAQNSLDGITLDGLASSGLGLDALMGGSGGLGGGAGGATGSSLHGLHTLHGLDALPAHPQAAATATLGSTHLPGLSQSLVSSAPRKAKVTQAPVVQQQAANYALGISGLEGAGAQAAGFLNSAASLGGLGAAAANFASANLVQAMLNSMQSSGGLSSTDAALLGLGAASGSDRGKAGKKATGKADIAISLGADPDGHFWKRDDKYYQEIATRATAVVQAGLCGWMGPNDGRKKLLGVVPRGTKAKQHMEALNAGETVPSGVAQVGLQNTYWEANIWLDTRSLTLGCFKTAAEAAVAFDYAQTYLRPSLKSQFGKNVAINFAGSASDCRYHPPIDPWPEPVSAGMAPHSEEGFAGETASMGLGGAGGSALAGALSMSGGSFANSTLASLGLGASGGAGLGGLSLAHLGPGLGLSLEALLANAAAGVSSGAGPGASVGTAAGLSSSMSLTGNAAYDQALLQAMLTSSVSSSSAAAAASAAPGPGDLSLLAQQKQQEQQEAAEQEAALQRSAAEQEQQRQAAAAETGAGGGGVLDTAEGDAALEAGNEDGPTKLTEEEVQVLYQTLNDTHMSDPALHSTLVTIIQTLSEDSLSSEQKEPYRAQLRQLAEGGNVCATLILKMSEETVPGAEL